MDGHLSIAEDTSIPWELVVIARGPAGSTVHLAFQDGAAEARKVEFYSAREASAACVILASAKDQNEAATLQGLPGLKEVRRAGI
ncbi:hypothetical protein [Arthrobacter caoxuetaonis]|uniref:Uncharacterized protein n=1 Tax=Arthrobacter caoxuetaonis TaxID=2886935 RepID=A0A9X1MG93_9MICC|nr:hypothetical protein [Arthrobacter caoxuetaonis]MCC3299256.1 hypothetical protein [Arthrobacter caoxuetaonis]USQ59250.1 hypothetical protein NF551_16840 [Arthrobacter caoxuetaonis]